MTLIPQLTLAEAKTLNKCRICAASVLIPKGSMPKDWADRFDEILKPFPMKLAFGKEFAHTGCIEAWKESGGVDLVVSEAMVLATCVGDIRKVLEDLPDSLPVHLAMKNKFINPVIAVVNNTETLKRYGTPALEIRDI